MAGALACLLALCSLGTARAGETVVVGTKQAPPFAMRDEGSANGWTGLSIELWEAIAASLGLETVYRELPLKGLIDELEARRIDVAVAALTVTAEREARVDFSQPYFRSRLGVAMQASPGSSLVGLLGVLLSSDFLRAVGALVVLLLGVGALAWLAERRANAEQFGGGTLEGLGSGFWWSAVTMTTVGYGDKSPRTFWGRILGIVWMFTSIIIIAGVTGAIASAFTVQSLRSGVDDLDDLLRLRTATLVGSTSERFLVDAGARPRGYERIEGALAALETDEYDALVYDAPVLKHYIASHHAGSLEVLPLEFGQEAYAIAVPEESERLEAINRALLDFLTRPAWDQIERRYLGD